MEGARSGMRILVVEDEPHVRLALQRALTAHQHNVVACGSAGAAIDNLRHGAFDLIVLDVNLPDSSGWNVLRQHGPVDLPPTIVMSAVAPASVRTRQFQPFAVLLKPFPIGALLRLADRVAKGEAAREFAGD